MVQFAAVWRTRGGSRGKPVAQGGGSCCDQGDRGGGDGDEKGLDVL